VELLVVDVVVADVVTLVDEEVVVAPVDDVVVVDVVVELVDAPSPDAVEDVVTPPGPVELDEDEDAPPEPGRRGSRPSAQAANAAA
jgi:hypothetical protein